MTGRSFGALEHAECRVAVNQSLKYLRLPDYICSAAKHEVRLQGVSSYLMVKTIFFPKVSQTGC